MTLYELHRKIAATRFEALQAKHAKNTQAMNDAFTRLTFYRNALKARLA